MLNIERYIAGRLGWCGVWVWSMATAPNIKKIMMTAAINCPKTIKLKAPMKAKINNNQSSSENDNPIISLKVRLRGIVTLCLTRRHIDDKLVAESLETIGDDANSSKYCGSLNQRLFHALAPLPVHYMEGIKHILSLHPLHEDSRSEVEKLSSWFGMRHDRASRHWR